MANGIKIGNLDISSFKVGGDDCKIYLGNTLLYPTVKYKYQAKYTDGSEYNIECDTATGLTSADTRVSSYTDVSAVTVGDCIITLKTNAFSGFTSLESVSLPDSLVNINFDAFRGCSSLTSLNIPSTVTYFGNRAFSNCVNLESINIPSGVTSIPLNCFANCYSLEEIEIPSGMTTIGGGSFSNCSGLTSVTVLATTPPTIAVSAFNNTNDCPIYVPADSVSSYKSSWIDYTSRIKAIPSSTPQWVTFSNGDTIPSDLQIYGIKGIVNDLKEIFSNYNEDILVEDESHNRYGVYIGGFENPCYNEVDILSNTSVEYTFSNIGCSDSYTVSSKTIANISNDIQLYIYA